MWQRFTERARRVVFFAQEEAGRLGENYVSTEHLLLGLVRENDSVAARILDRLGVSLSRIRSEIERQVTRGDGRLGQDMQLTPRAKRVIDLAYDEARQLNNNYIGTEHLLLGLIREGEGLAGRVLAKLGVDLERTRAIVQELQDQAGGSPSAAADVTGIVAKLRERIQSLITKMRAPEIQKAAQEAGLNVDEELAQMEEEIDRLAEPAKAREGMSPPAEWISFPVRAALHEDRLQLKGKSLLSIADLAREQIEGILVVTQRMEQIQKANRPAFRYTCPKSLALIFEKPSLRTRVTFDLGMRQMGGLTVVLGPAEIGLGTRESIPDAARNLERWVDAIMARVFDHNTLVVLRDHCKIPIINGLSDREHPCQILADLYTIQQKKGTLEGLKLAWVGDGNNVLHSLLLGGALTGMTVAAACPEGYEPLEEIVQQAREIAGEDSPSKILLTSDPVAAVSDADVVYTDVWTSMGQEAEQPVRQQVFRPYQVNAELMARAKPDALFMHCLPAHRGEEVTDDVLDGPQSVVFDQAENRLHAQKAVLALLIGP